MTFSGQFASIHTTQTPNGVFYITQQIVPFLEKIRHNTDIIIMFNKIQGKRGVHIEEGYDPESHTYFFGETARKRFRRLMLSPKGVVIYFAYLIMLVLKYLYTRTIRLMRKHGKDT